MNGKVALITGSTSGIGLGIAEHLASLGYHIALNGLGKPEEIHALVDQLKKKYAIDCQYFEVNLALPSEGEALIHHVIKAMGKVDIIVNNAGIQHVSPIEEFSLADWQKVIDINLTTPFVLTKAAITHMKQRNWGRIINIASVHGLVASLHKAAYVSAKHGLIGLSKVTTLETARTGITCNTICPGWVLTPLVEKQIEERAAKSGKTFEEEKEALLLEKQPSGEFVTVSQIAGLVAYLCSESADQMRGGILTMDGGWVCQ